jgi:hypothetical protein
MPDSEPGPAIRSHRHAHDQALRSPDPPPTTLLAAIARSVAELERSGRPARVVIRPIVQGALA